MLGDGERGGESDEGKEEGETTDCAIAGCGHWQRSSWGEYKDKANSAPLKAKGAALAEKGKIGCPRHMCAVI